MIGMEALVLSYFDRIVGPIITHSMMLDDVCLPVQLPKDLQTQIQKFIDSQIDEGFFSHGFKMYSTANYYFNIHSDWARGKNEFLCLTIVSLSKMPGMFKPALEACVTRIKAIPDMYKAFYHAKKAEDADVEKRDHDLLQILEMLVNDAIDAQQQAIVMDGVRERERDFTRDNARDIKRDIVRDKGRDQARDLTRDETRDKLRDLKRDVPRDKKRDLDHDSASGQGDKG